VITSVAAKTANIGSPRTEVIAKIQAIASWKKRGFLMSDNWSRYIDEVVSNYDIETKYRDFKYRGLASLYKSGTLIGFIEINPCLNTLINISFESAADRLELLQIAEKIEKKLRGKK
jgi:hypothetical protein